MTAATSTTQGSLNGATVHWQADLDDAPVAVTAASGLLAVAGASGLCGVYDTERGESVATLAMAEGLLDVAFSPDGSHLALVGPAGHAVWHARDGRLEVTETGEWSARARWFDNDRLAVASGRRVSVLSTGGAPLWSTGPAPSTVTDMCWLRQGREIAVAAYNGVYRYARHQPAPMTHFPYSGSHLAIAASSNGRWICTGNQDRSVHIWRTRDGDELEMAGFPDKVTRIAFDDGDRWFANDGAPEVTVWDFAGKGPSGRAPRLLAGHRSVTALAWRPGGAGVLATTGSEGDLAVWRVESGSPGRPTIPLHTIGLDGPGVALRWLDAHHVAAADRTGSVRVVAFDV
ncbi:WD40 repeat domain-containing protein [Actinopolymorpha pittospori]|uniref:WD40 repeat protein n=2 Tax=Actinopolymorpha pittospori TaxID=648752 RepID=A0A927RHG6_9ACTN|nr:WD40 repeat domain-containing protein [Actinopolymorpha pittospori]MBE1603438.1 WD40 repeat protein [Actinopolymorpha pittospori]